MNIESALGYVTLHSQSIIQWLFLVIVLLVGTLVAQALFFRREVVGHGALAPADLTDQLNKLIEASSKGQGVEGAGGGGDPARVQTLEAELQARAEEITSLKETVAKAPTAAMDSGVSERLKELEAKLAEYEILEDDIADLSLYKEENTRLKTELETLKISGPAPEAPPATAVAQPGFEAPLAPLPDAAPARTAEAAAEAALAAAAFDEPAAPVAPPSAAAADAAEAAQAADDLFAEFATALEDGAAADGPKAG